MATKHRCARNTRATLSAVFMGVVLGAAASDLDTIGVSALRTLDPSLTGAGVQVGQPEAGNPGSAWQVNPAAVDQPVSLFTWRAAGGSSTNYPNSLGQESGHADQVGSLFYGGTNGVAPGLAHVDNDEANYFYTLIQLQTVISGRVVNQSFTFGSQDPDVDDAYDNYVGRWNTLFLSGVGNSGPVSSPATAYNGLGVGAYNGSSSIGPTSDGRCKPDITAPAGLTSFSTPLVAGGAAVLLQAGIRGDAGSGTASFAADPRSIKALLLNGAEKTFDWTNGVTTPLDARYGAGVLNLLNSYRQLRRGMQPASTTTSSPAGGPHDPPAVTNVIPVRRGWDFTVLTNSADQDRVDHYFFDLSSATNRQFTLTATVVWQRQRNQSAINDLDLFLFDANTSALLASSQSTVDNVEHLHVTGLPAGRFDLQALKNGAALKSVTPAETYALAFDFGPIEAPTLIDPRVVGTQFSARLSGEPMQAYEIQVSEELIIWTPILTNSTSMHGSFDFADIPPPGLDRRFYRAVERP